jgi:hypothetical protein
VTAICQSEARWERNEGMKCKRDERTQKMERRKEKDVENRDS